MERTHGMSYTKIHRAWADMLSRCNNPNHQNYKNYGGRGITVCSRWHKFIDFLSDIGEPPEGFVLDRVDNNGNYGLLNCRWTDKKTSRRNSRSVKLSMEEAVKIRELYSEGCIQEEMAERFNVHQVLISRVVSGKVWV